MLSYRRAVGIVTLVSLVVLFACGGSTGPQGEAGPPGDRTKLYWRYSGANLGPSGLTTSVRCDKAADMPWAGGCEAADLPLGLYLEVSQELDWNDSTQPAGWTCTWAPYDGIPNITFGANAEICCYDMGGT